MSVVSGIATTVTTAPRVTVFCGEARNAIVAATSSTFGHLP